MRLILWIAIFVSTLAGASYGYHCFERSQMIAHPAYIEEFRHEVAAAENVAVINREHEAECEHLRQIDWSGILNNHTFFNGLAREDVSADAVWTLHLSLLTFLGMEYDLFEIEQLDGDSLTYHHLAYSDSPEVATPSATESFEAFRQEVCGIHRVRPLIYVASELGQVALPLPDDFNDRFMNQAEFRQLLGKRINKRFRVNINQSHWTVEDFLDLTEQP